MGAHGRLISLFWLRVERAPDLAIDLLPGALLVFSGVVIMCLSAFVR